MNDLRRFFFFAGPSKHASEMPAPEKRFRTKKDTPTYLPEFLHLHELCQRRVVAPHTLDLLPSPIRHLVERKLVLAVTFEHTAFPAALISKLSPSLLRFSYTSQQSSDLGCHALQRHSFAGSCLQTETVAGVHVPPTVLD